MAAAQRTDVHRPAVLDPADYAYVGECDAHVGDEYSFAFDWQRYAELTGQAELAGNDSRDAEGIRWATVLHASGEGGCDHCGQRGIRYWTFFLHLPSGEVVQVGGECARVLGAESREVAAQRAEMQRRQVAEEVKAWREADERHERVFELLMAAQDAAGGTGGGGNEFMDSLYRQLTRKGCLSEKQVEACLRGEERRQQRAEEREERDAHLPAPAAVVTGRIEVTGWLLTTKTQESDYGSTLKMLVMDDRGFKVWGTCPGGIIDEAYEMAREAGLSEGGVVGALRAGMKVRVRFTATVERSKDDETFGYFKRPTKARIEGREEQ